MGRARRWATLTAFVLAAQLGCSPTSPSGGPIRTATGATAAREKGIKEATVAIAAGKLLLKEYPPLPSPAEHGEYIKLLRERCGVEYEVPRLPPGVAEADFIQEVRGWNETMQAEIKRKFGEGIFTELHDEARRRWQEKVRPRGKE
jgi:hypothetical protein